MNWWQKILFVLAGGGITYAAFTIGAVDIGNNATSTASSSIPTTYIQVQKKQIVGVQHYYVYKNIDTNEIVTETVSKANYDDWLNKVMTIPNHPTPSKPGYVWIGSKGGEIQYKPVIPAPGEYQIEREASATTSSLFKVNRGGVIEYLDKLP